MTTAVLHGPAEGRTAAAFPSAREALYDLGFCQLPDLWPPGLVDDLAREAQQSGMAQRVPEDFDRSAEGRRWRFDHYGLNSGPLLAAVCTDRRLLSLICALTGRRVAPRVYSYLYYQAGGSMGLHLDRPDADFTLSTQLSGDLGPLLLHPELVGQTEERLDAIAEETGGQPRGGVPLSCPRQGATLVRGRIVPHRRPPSDRPGVICITAYEVRP